MGERGGDPFLHLGWILEADAADPDGLRHRRKVRILELGPEVEKAGGLLLELDEAEGAVVEYDRFRRQAKLLEADEIAHQHREPAVARQRDDLAAGVARLGADRLGHGVGHRAVPERAEQPPLGARREIARRPNRRQADIARENRVWCGEIADRFCDLLGMDDAMAQWREATLAA